MVEPTLTQTSIFWLLLILTFLSLISAIAVSGRGPVLLFAVSGLALVTFVVTSAPGMSSGGRLFMWAWIGAIVVGFPLCILAIGRGSRRRRRG